MSSNFYNTQIADPTDEEVNEGYRQWRRIRTAKYVISSTLALVGLLILGSQLGPLGVSYVEGMLLEQQTTSIKDPAPAQELTPDSGDLPYYDPGVSYFRNLIAHIGTASVAGVSSDGIYPDQQTLVQVDSTYSTPMKIFIPSIGISDITITPNVDSLNEKTYNAALKNGLAHFLGTPIPGDGGNSFIYGHSAVESFFSRHPDNPETIFSRLEKIEIADTVSIERDGKTLTYVVQKKKISEPNNFDVILGATDKETITLMTCWPLGIGSKRLIVIAERTDG
jgi:LPXTG-site transpeptidase (sortase) family protein